MGCSSDIIEGVWEYGIHAPEDRCRSDVHEWAITFFLVVAWHGLRCWFCTGGKDSFSQLIATHSVDCSEAGTKHRNNGHNALGMYHCIGVLVLTSVLLFQHWHQSWDEWFGLRDPARLDYAFMVQPWWPLAFSGAYFVSDLIYIFDFPVFLWHHIVSIVLIGTCLVSVEMRFMGVVILWCAEVGGILLSTYYRMPTLPMYALFCLCYGGSRIVFTYVSVELFYSNRKSTRWVDDVAACLVGVLVCINWNFWWTHTCKLIRRTRVRLYGKDEGGEEEEEEESCGDDKNSKKEKKC